MKELIVDLKIAVPQDRVQPRLMEALMKRAGVNELIQIANEINWKVTITIEPPSDEQTH